MKKRDKDDPLKKLMTRKEKGEKRPKHDRGRAPKYKYNEDIVDKYLGEKMNLTNLALATMIKKNYGKTITIDKLSHELSVANIHPDDHMPDVEDALNRLGVKVIPSWSTKKTKVGDKSGRKKIKKAGKFGMTVEMYLGESKNTATIDYKKVQGADWIIYDEGTGEIQKVVKAGKNTDPRKHFVSSKSAAMSAFQAATKMSHKFLKKNKGFNILVKAMAFGAETDLVPASGGAKFVKRKNESSVPDKHQLKILKDTIRNPSKGKFLGGPSAEEAEETLKTKFGYSDAQIKKLKK